MHSGSGAHQAVLAVGISSLIAQGQSYVTKLTHHSDQLAN